MTHHIPSLRDAVSLAKASGWSTSVLTEKYPCYTSVQVNVMAILMDVHLRGEKPAIRASLENLVRLVRQQDKSTAKLASMTGYSVQHVRNVVRTVGLPVPKSTALDRAPLSQPLPIPRGMAKSKEAPPEAKKIMHDGANGHLTVDLPPMAPPPALQPGYTLNAPAPSTTRDLGQLASDYDILRAGLDLLYGQLDRELTDPGRTLDQRRATITQMMRVEKVREDLK